jgi:hypothetical protein
MESLGNVGSLIEKGRKEQGNERITAQSQSGCIYLPEFIWNISF